MLVVSVIYLALVALMIASMWVVFTKAGQPGWAALIPFYNTYILLVIAGKPGWWLVLMLIPFINIIFLILALCGLANAFGKGGGFVVGLIFLPIVFLPILAFGDATYTPPASA